MMMQEVLALIQSPELSKAIGNVVAVLAALGVGIEFTPFIKLNPISWALKKLGKAFNHETLEVVKDLRTKMEALDKNFTQKQIDDLRWNILDFANSCRNHRKHTKEEFNHVIDAHKQYEKILAAHGMQNGQVDEDFKYIQEIYNECMHEDSFL